MADAYGSGPYGETLGGSSPLMSKAAQIVRINGIAVLSLVLFRGEILLDEPSATLLTGGEPR